MRNIFYLMLFGTVICCQAAEEFSSFPTKMEQFQTVDGPGKCSLCGKKGKTKPCKGCGARHYCTSACCRKDWKSYGGGHRSKCNYLKAAVGSVFAQKCFDVINPSSYKSTP